jgi:pilus assembly protein Flp/PilA
MPNPLSSALRDEAGATSIEYGLIAAVISVIILTTLVLVGPGFQGVFQRVVDAL